MCNVNIPPIECFIRAEYLRNLEDSHGTVFPCLVFGFSSIPTRVPLFHFLMEDGGIWWRMPISAFCWKPDAEPMKLEDLVLWDSFSYSASVSVFYILKDKRVQYISRDKKTYTGTYMFTIDWFSGNYNNLDIGFSEAPGQHKCGHVIKLDNGNFAIQPNNRILIQDPSFTTKSGKMIIERKLNSNIWSVEDKPKWTCSDDDKYYYDIKEK